jgi:hypothetical protein
MCISNIKLYKRPIKKAYKVLLVCNNYLYAPVELSYEYRLTLNHAMDEENQAIHFFASKSAAKHYCNCLHKNYSIHKFYKVFEASIPKDAVVYKGYSDNSFGFNAVRYPVMYTTSVINIIGECK